MPALGVAVGVGLPQASEHIGLVVGVEPSHLLFAVEGTVVAQLGLQDVDRVPEKIRVHLFDQRDKVYVALELLLRSELIVGAPSADVLNALHLYFRGFIPTIGWRLLSLNGG